MEVSESKWVNTVLNIIGVDSLWLWGLLTILVLQKFYVLSNDIYRICPKYVLSEVIRGSSTDNYKYLEALKLKVKNIYNYLKCPKRLR